MGIGSSASRFLVNMAAGYWFLAVRAVRRCLFMVVAVVFLFSSSQLLAQRRIFGAAPLATSSAESGLATGDQCARPATGSLVSEPRDLYSHGGVLRVSLTYRNFAGPNGQMLYCYISGDGSESPTLHLKPGDLLILKLKNQLAPMAVAGVARVASGTQRRPMRMTIANPCASAEMTRLSTNLHFHGIDAPPTCHQDDVLRTMIQPSGPVFEYRLRVPRDQPPGLYWYHPHVHGLTNVQVQGGASGAMVIDGIEQRYPQLAGLPERILVVRDQPLVNPDAHPVQSPNVPPPQVLRDPEGDIMNTGTGTGKPAKDLSLNFVPVPYPTYAPAVIDMKPGQREFWRVLNASAITYLDLQLLFGGAPQPIGVVALDGAPIDENGAATGEVLWQSHALVPPAGRVEFIVEGPTTGAGGVFVTRSVDTGPGGENDPTRPLAAIRTEANAAELPALPRAVSQPSASSSSSRSIETQEALTRNRERLDSVRPIRVRKLYFSEEHSDPRDPNSPTAFFLTVEGQQPKVFDPSLAVPNIVARQGDVEDWIIENRTNELHAFHIHQLHFVLLEWNGVPVDEPYLRDTVNVAYWDGKSPVYPSVRLRMDFRGPNVVGTFLYHCHLLEHEDGGMMGMIRVDPARAGVNLPAPARLRRQSSRAPSPALVATRGMLMCLPPRAVTQMKR